MFAYFKQRDSLTTLFNQLNHTHFNSSLPRYRVQREPGECHTDGGFLMGQTFCRRRFIVIAYGLSATEERRTLLHEMAHLAMETDKSTHGPAFQQELSRLAALGERWAWREALAYRLDTTDPSDRTPSTAVKIAELWAKHGHTWRKRDYAKRSRAASKAAFNRMVTHSRAGQPVRQEHLEHSAHQPLPGSS